MKKNIKYWLLYIFFSSAFVIAVSETFLRYYIDYNPSYYVAFNHTEQGILHYPYGDIPINSDHFPDQEFSRTKTMPRIGYFGDSVCFGIGAGYGYRLTEHLEKEHGTVEHMNFCYVSNGMNSYAIDETTELAQKFDLDSIIYLMNLNDILPDIVDTKPQEKVAGEKFLSLESILGVSNLRGRSYLYTALRTVVKTTMVRLGYGAHGQISFELFPQQNRGLVEDTANRIGRLKTRLDEIDVRLTVVMLPYEMQISKNAAETYARAGINWEPGFIDRETQRILSKKFDELEITWIDAFHSFTEPNVGAGREFKVGEAFVYNKGDKLDWNHPNRLGHQLIAKYLNKESKKLYHGIEDLETPPSH